MVLLWYYFFIIKRQLIWFHSYNVLLDFITIRGSVFLHEDTLAYGLEEIKPPTFWVAHNLLNLLIYCAASITKRSLASAARGYS